MNEEKSKGAFWGFFLLTIGILLLLDNMNIIQFYWHDVLRLWPLLFIFWGINLLPGNETFKLIVKLIILGIALYWVVSNPSEPGTLEDFDSITL